MGNLPCARLLWNARCYYSHCSWYINIINKLYCILNQMMHHPVQCFSYLETDFAISFMWPHNYKAFISCEYSDSQVNKIFTGLNKTTKFSSNFQSLVRLRYSLDQTLYSVYCRYLNCVS